MQQLLGLCSALSSPLPPNYSNPIIVEAGVDLGDPGALWVNGPHFRIPFLNHISHANTGN
jgi:hypothetical protein